MPRQALAAIFVGSSRPLELRSIVVPDPVDQEILIRVTTCTLCGSDLHTYEGRRQAPTPSILGHEILGVIEAFGPSARRRDHSGLPLNQGDRVTWSIIAHCGECHYCRVGLPQKCERMIKYGHEPLTHGLRGGLAEYCVLAPGSTVFRIPEALSDLSASPASCATATAAAGIRAAGVVRDRVVLIQGAGMLGLTACAMAAEAGAAEVVCTDLNPARLARARAFGATVASLPGELPAVVSEVTGRRGVDAAIELTGSPDAFETAWPLLRIGATYILIGAVYPSRSLSIAMESIVRRHLTIRGVHNYAPDDLGRALEFLERSLERPFEGLVEHSFPLDQADEAFHHAREGGAFRVAVRS